MPDFNIAPAAHFVVTGDDARAREDLESLGAQDVVIPSELTADRVTELLRTYSPRPRKA